MKLEVVSRTGRADLSRYDTSVYEASHKGGLSILDGGRPAATWSRVSPAILGEIDDYVHALAGRRS